MLGFVSWLWFQSATKILFGFLVHLNSPTDCFKNFVVLGRFSESRVKVCLTHRFVSTIVAPLEVQAAVDIRWRKRKTEIRVIKATPFSLGGIAVEWMQVKLSLYYTGIQAMESHHCIEYGSSFVNLHNTGNNSGRDISAFVKLVMILRMVHVLLQKLFSSKYVSEGRSVFTFSLTLYLRL